MRLDRLPEYLLSILVTLIGLVFALYAGSQLGSGNTRNVMMVAGGCAYLLAGILFKDKIWILPLIFIPATGKVLSTPLTLSDATILLAFSWFLIFKAFKLIRTKPVYELSDVLVALNLVYIGIMFIRNPVGGLVLNSDLIGGRPYLSIFFATLAYWVFARAEVTTTLVRRLPYLCLLGVLPMLIVSVIAAVLPSATFAVARIYAGIDGMGGMDVSVESGGRLRAFGPFGLTFGILLVALYRPVTFINPLYLKRMLMMMVAFGFILLSGFRSIMISFAMITVACSYYRGKVSDLLKVGVLLGPIAGLLLAMQGTLLDLPFPVQRTLSFLPLNWNPKAVEDAEHSTEWRIIMWKWMWNEEKYLQNWWLGDGFGYSKTVLLDDLATEARGGGEFNHEAFLITGRVHSGPLSAIRFGGYVGLTLYVLLMLVIIRQASRFIRRTRGTPWFFPALYFAVPMTVYLPFFIVIYGAYEKDLPKAIMWVGILKLLERSFNRYLEEEEEKKKAAEEAKPPEAAPNLMDQRPAMLTR
jgi:hypothetical protein